MPTVIKGCVLAEKLSMEAKVGKCSVMEFQIINMSLKYVACD